MRKGGNEEGKHRKKEYNKYNKEYKNYLLVEIETKGKKLWNNYFILQERKNIKLWRKKYKGK